MKRNFISSIIIISFFILGNNCFAQKSLNLNFELDNYEKYWFTNELNLSKISLDTLEKHNGRYSLKVEMEPTQGVQEIFATILPYDIFAGKSVELRGWVKTKGVKNGCVDLWFHVSSEGISDEYLKIVRNQSALSGDNDWTQLSIKVDVNKSVNMILCGGVFIGEGTAWYDDFELYVNDEKYVDYNEPSPKSTLSQEEIKILKQYVYPLKTYEPDDESIVDLKILNNLIGKNNVIALGEVSHGSSEIFKLKNRMIQYLVTHNGFNVFSLEANMPEANKLNNYIVSGEGNPKEIISGMKLWTWNTEEMLNMVEWMRVFNQPKQRIKFTGFDMQLYQGAVNELFDAFEKNNEVKKTIIELNNKLDITAERLKQTSNNSMRLKENQIVELNSLLSFIGNKINDSQFENSKKQWLHQNLTIIRQNMAMKSGFDFNRRDTSMFQNFMWIKDQNKDSKFIIWGHNSHIMKNSMRDIQIPTYNVMGQYLSNELKRNYVNFGFTFFDGSYMSNGSKGISSYQSSRAIDGTLEYLLSQLDEPIFILDLKKIKADKDVNMKWLLDCIDYRAIGGFHSSAYHVAFHRQRKIHEDFDYLVFIKNSSPSNLFLQTKKKIFSFGQNKTMKGYNLNFENLTNELPTGWQINGTENIKFTSDSLNVKSGKYSASIECKEGTSQFGIYGLIILDKYDGREITISGYIKSENIINGNASIFIRIDPKISFNDIKVTGTTEWTKYEITSKIDSKNMNNIAIGMMLNGNGKVWFDNLRITIDGEDIDKLNPIGN